MDENGRGALGEAKVQSDLIESGFTVSIPVQPAHYDLVAERNGELYRVQVKAAGFYQNRNTIKAQIMRSSRATKKRKYSADAFDILAVWGEPLDVIAYKAWEESVWSFSFCLDDEDIPSRAEHMVNRVGDQTIEDAIERLKSV